MNTTSVQSGHHWMLVDDNENIFEILSAMLTNLADATVECHNSPQNALAAFAENPAAYKLVITDFEMPGMDGVELCRRMHALNPEQKIILSTGSGFFTEAAAQHAGFCALLNKPFSLPQLKQALAENFLLKDSEKISHFITA